MSNIEVGAMARRSGAAACVAAAALLAAHGAAAANYIGSASFVSIRACSATASQPCSGGSVVASAQDGGANRTSLTSVDDGHGDSAMGHVFWDDRISQFAILQGKDSTAGAFRANVTDKAFQTFTNYGLFAMQLSLTTRVHFASSSTSPHGDQYPGGAGFYAYSAIWDNSIGGGFGGAGSIIGSGLFGAGCGTPGVIGMAELNGTLSGGDQTFKLTTRGCSPSGIIMLDPGAQVLVANLFQMPVNRGGFADATHTFGTDWGEDLTEAQRSDLRQYVAGAAVPEPAAWALLIAGFGLTGQALRRRRAPARGLEPA